tara:strand:- start:1730 stop:2254 length:525 start_codon:yes stop_codon:yes gene_type:complete
MGKKAEPKAKQQLEYRNDTVCEIYTHGIQMIGLTGRDENGRKYFSNFLEESELIGILEDLTPGELIHLEDDNPGLTHSTIAWGVDPREYVDDVALMEYIQELDYKTLEQLAEEMPKVFRLMDTRGLGESFYDLVGNRSLDTPYGEIEDEEIDGDFFSEDGEEDNSERDLPSSFA